MNEVSYGVVEHGIAPDETDIPRERLDIVVESTCQPFVDRPQIHGLFHHPMGELSATSPEGLEY
eukprot:151694-Amorphochlora_amoeboformis.AAC.1